MGRRKLKAQAGAAAGTGTGVETSEINHVVAHQSGNSGFRDQPSKIFAVCGDKAGMIDAELLRRVSADFRRFSGLRIDHAPRIEIFAVVFPVRRRLDRRCHGQMMDHVQHGPLHFPAGLITVRQCRRMMIEQADAVLLQGIRHLGKIHMKQIPIGKKIPAEMRAENNGGIGGSLCDPFCAPFDFVMDSGISQFQIRPLNPPTDGSHFFTSEGNVPPRFRYNSSIAAATLPRYA